MSLLAGCDGRSDGRVVLDLRQSPNGAEKPVARFGDDAIGAEELAERFAQMPAETRAHHQTLARKREYLEGLVRFELLAREAARRGHHRRPEVVTTTKKAIVQSLLNEVMSTEAPTEARLRQAYEEGLEDYRRPAQLRLLHIFWERGTPDRRRERLDEARRVRRAAAALSGDDLTGFGALAREHSEDPASRPLGGDLRFRSEAELEELWGGAVAHAAAALTAPGELSQLVESERGVHLLRLLERKPAREIPFEAARPQLARWLEAQSRSAAYDSLLEELAEREELIVDDAALADVPVDAAAPANPTEGPAPGFIAPRRTE